MQSQNVFGYVLILLGVAAVAILLLVWILSDQPDPQLGDQTATSTSQINTEDWSGFSARAADTFSFSLRHPETIAVRQVQNGIYEIVYIGPNAVPNSEITDGYLATIEFLEAPDAEAYANNRNDADQTHVTNFVGYPAFQYFNRSELSNELIPHHVFVVPGHPDYVADISYQTFGETRAQYETELLTMFRTLSFADVSPNTNTDPQSLIQITSPQAGTAVDNPLRLTGQARGYWFFEATAPVVVVDWDGRIIGEGFITADGEWMTENFVPFSGEITYDLPADSYSASGTIIFQKSNPSGLPQNDAAVEIPVILEE